MKSCSVFGTANGRGRRWAWAAVRTKVREGPESGLSQINDHADERDLKLQQQAMCGREHEQHRSDVTPIMVIMCF